MPNNYYDISIESSTFGKKAHFRLTKKVFNTTADKKALLSSAMMEAISQINEAEFAEYKKLEE